MLFAILTAPPVTTTPANMIKPIHMIEPPLPTHGGATDTLSDSGALSANAMVAVKDAVLSSVCP